MEDLFNNTVKTCTIVKNEFEKLKWNMKKEYPWQWDANLKKNKVLGFFAALSLPAKRLETLVIIYI